MSLEESASSNFFKQTTLVDLNETESLLPMQNEPLPLPEKIGPYAIDMILAKGGMSVLYLATNPKTAEPLVIKVLSPRLASHPEIVQRFLKEAEIISLTHHPNIVKLYGQGQWEGGVYIAMELIQGISLRQMILQHSFTIKRSLEIVLQIGYALFHLHAHGVIHRDLKPENILLTEEGGVKVIDFGIAQLEEEEAMLHSPMMGTPTYMSPEQKNASSLVSYNCDIYSLGVITYELVLGQLCYGKIILSLMPLGLQKILSQALQIDPKQRYQDIVDFITDLNSYMESADFQKETNRADCSSSLFEELKEAQRRFLPQNAPHWPKLDIGFTSTHHLSIMPLYYDFLEIEGGSMVILLAEASAEGAAALLYTTFLKGLVTACRPFLQDPVLFMKHMNELVIASCEDQLFSMSVLILNPVKNQLQFICCGFGALWSIQPEMKRIRKITAENIALGIENEPAFSSAIYPWNIGDRLFLCSFRALAQNNQRGLTESELQKALIEALFLPCQKQTESLLRKIAPPSMDLQQEAPLVLISLARTS